MGVPRSDAPRSSVGTERPATAALLHEAVQQHTSVALAGLPGCGRTTLLAGLRETAERGGWTVLTVAAARAGARRPLESLLLSGAYAPTPPGAASLSGAVAAVEQLLRPAPALVLVDDADALDDVSAAVLGTVTAARGIPVVAAQHPPVPAAGVATVLAGRPATAVTVPALAFEEVHGLVTVVLGGDVDADVTSRVYGLSGGLPGIVRSLLAEARRDGRLVHESGRWVARRDLLTPALAVEVHRQLSGLGAEELHGVEVLAALGVAGLPTVRELLDRQVLVALHDRGLLRLVEADGQTLAVLYPPLVGEHLRQTGGLRQLHAVEEIAAALGSGRRDRWEPLDPGPHPVPEGWAASRESAAVLGRVLRRHAAARLLARRDSWERHPTLRHGLLYLDALVDDGAPADVVDEVLAQVGDAERRTPTGPASFLLSWEAVYRATVRQDRDGARHLLEAAPAPATDDAAMLVATAQHLQLTLGDVHADPAVLVPPPDDLPAGDADPAGAPAAEQIVMTAAEAVRLVRGEVLLAQGRVTEAGAEFTAATVSRTAQRHDGPFWESLAAVCTGDVASATERAARLLDRARGTLDFVQIEPYGYVVALGLYLQGRLASLREHLTGVFVTGSPSPLRPSTRSALLSLGGALALWEGHTAGARAMARQAEELQVLGAATPFARPAPLNAELAVAHGAVTAREATEPGWEDVTALADRGYLLTAVLDAAWLTSLWPDPDRAERLAEAAVSAQGRLLPALGRYLRAAAAGSVDDLLAVAGDLRAGGLLLHAAQAHAAAITLLRERGEAARARADARRLRELVGAAGENLALVVPSFEPVTALSPRELEVARLVSQGMSNRDVARRLVVSDRTVDNHVYRIFRKLGLTSREELATALAAS